MTGVGAMAPRLEMPVSAKGRVNPDAAKSGRDPSGFADLVGKGEDGANLPKTGEKVVPAKDEARDTRDRKLPAAARIGQQASVVREEVSVENLPGDSSSKPDAAKSHSVTALLGPQVPLEESADTHSNHTQKIESEEAAEADTPNIVTAAPAPNANPALDEPVPVDAEATRALEPQAPIVIAPPVASPVASRSPAAQVEAAPLRSLPLWSLRGGSVADAGAGEHRSMPIDTALVRPASIKGIASTQVAGGLVSRAAEAMPMPTGAAPAASERAVQSDAGTRSVARDALQPMPATERNAMSQNSGLSASGSMQTTLPQTQPTAAQPVAKTDGQAPPVALATVDVGRWLVDGTPPKALRETVASHVARASLTPMPGQSAPVLKLQLQPAHLGQVTVTIRAVGDTVSVQLAPQSEAAAQMLAGDRDAMATLLRSLGGSFAGANVEIAGEFGGRLDGEAGQSRFAPGGGRDDTGAQRGGSAAAGMADEPVNRPPDHTSDKAQEPGGRIII